MIQFRTLANGVRIAMDPMEFVRSCAIGIWLQVGSRHEHAREYGLANFLEHMLFKGTDKFSALELGDELNRLGGNFNAMTSQENLCLHAHCVDAKAPLVLDLLSHMLLESTFPKEELLRERNVVLEEYKMYEDNPDELIVDLFFRNLWPRCPLGRSIIGTAACIQSFTRQRLKRFAEREFDPSRILITVAGKFDVKACNRVINRFYAKIKKSRLSKPPSLVASKSRMLKVHHKRDIEQVHFCFGTQGPSRRSKDRYAFGLMNMIFGGAMSSRLFREIREKRGLAYSIQSFAQSFRDKGSFAIIGSTRPSNLIEVLDICRTEARKICDELVQLDELNLMREQVIDATLIGIESTVSRMLRLSESIISQGKPISYRDSLRRIKQVQPTDIRRVARRYLKNSPLAGAFIGPEVLDLGPLRALKF